MGQLIDSVQIRIKQTSTGLFALFLRVATGLFVGLCFALIGQELVSYGSLTFWIVLVLWAGVFLGISKKWKPLGVIIFNLVFVLVGLLLRMYILIAPG